MRTPQVAAPWGKHGADDRDEIIKELLSAAHTAKNWLDCSADEGDLEVFAKLDKAIKKAEA